MQYLSSLDGHASPWSTRLVSALAGIALLSLTACGGGGEGSLPDTGNEGESPDADAGDIGGDDGYTPPRDGGDDTDEGDGTNGGGDECDELVCTPGDKRCNEEGKHETCLQSDDGCGRWGQTSKCDDDEFCRDESGLCEAKADFPCEFQDECSANANCLRDDEAEDGFVCECHGNYVDYNGDGTICFPNYVTAVDAGTFQMGSPTGETGRDGDESRHQVEISHPLAVQKYEVTQATWGEFEENGEPWKDASGCTQTVCPVFGVSWWDALHFANRMSEKHGLEQCYELQNCAGTPGADYTCSEVTFEGVGCEGWRLPTEAEWEYVARAGTSTATYNGDLSDATTDETVGAIGWYRSNAEGQPHEWGGKEANDWGLYDTSGNVAEWVWDWYGDYDSGSQTDPTGADSGSERVIRGGHWDSPAAACRSADRDKATPETRNDEIGFRVVRTLPAN